MSETSKAKKNLISLWGLNRWIVGFAGLLLSHLSFALPVIPMTYSGSVNYNYSYNKADQSEAETATLSTTITGTGFIWQPWFATLGVGLSVGLSESGSNTNDSDSSSTVTSGNIQFNVFPESRFPFMLALSRTDSRLESSGSSLSVGNHFVSTRFFLSQTYYGRTGFISRFSWDHNKFESERDSSTSDSLAASLRGRQAKHRYSASATYARSERSNYTYEPAATRLELQHSYVPNTELNVSSNSSYNRNDSGTGSSGISENVQASSVFSWRPIDRPYSISGGARVSASDSGSGSESKSMSTNIGGSYQIARSLRLYATGTVSASEADGARSVVSSETANLSYYSQPYFVGGFSWNWNSALSFANSNIDNDGDKSSQQSTSIGLSHSFNRNWATGRTSSLNLAFTQSGNASKSSEADDVIYGVGHGLGLGWSRRGVSSGTFANMTLSDSRTAGEESTKFQQLTAQLTQRNVLTRVSALSANVVFQASKQDVPGSTSESSEPKTLSASASYTNGRTFGIYPLRFSTSLSYNKRVAKGTNDSANTESESRFDYRVGLLTTSVTFRIMQVEGGTQSETLTFSLTRTF